MKKTDFEDFAYAGRKQKPGTVILTLVATMIGASATIGLSARTASIGFPAFWWLACGSIGLILQSALLSGKIRESGAGTLPKLADITVSRTAGTGIAAIIVVSWVGIVGAQFVASGSLAVSLIETLKTAASSKSGAGTASVLDTGTGYRIAVIAVWAVVTAYTTFGGQVSVIKTDIAQAALIFIGVLAALICVFVSKGSGSAETGFSNSLVFKEITLLNDKFTLIDLIYLLFITGGTYFLGPDIVSRNVIAKDASTARKAVKTSALILLVFSLMITLVSLWGRIYLGAVTNPLLSLMSGTLPATVSVLLAFSLASSLLSSADTSLINAAVIAETSLFRGQSVARTRTLALAISTLAMLLALARQDVISIFLTSYSVYSPGVVFPLSFAVYFHGKRKINKPVWYSGVILGSLSGLLSAIHAGSLFGGALGAALSWPLLPLAGMCVSLLTSVLSVCV